LNGTPRLLLDRLSRLLDRLSGLLLDRLSRLLLDRLSGLLLLEHSLLSPTIRAYLPVTTCLLIEAKSIQSVKSITNNIKLLAGKSTLSSWCLWKLRLSWSRQLRLGGLTLIEYRCLPLCELCSGGLLGTRTSKLLD
jgi:hypothetical protein